MDREKVIKGMNELEGFLFKKYGEVSSDETHVWYDRFLVVSDAITLLKEQEAKTQGADSGMCEICSFYERAMPVKPILDEQTGRIWLCGKCGSYVGFEDNDPHDPNEFDKYCRECGRPVLWEGR